MRAFLVDRVPDGTSRGGHAHRKARQFMICLAGRVTVELRFQGEKVSVQLDRPAQALLVEPTVWARETYFDRAQLLVFASESYDHHDYIQDS